MEQQTTDAPKKRGRPPKVAAVEIDGVVRDVSALTAARLRPPPAPVLAKEIVDHVLSRYEWRPGDWRVVLTSLAYIQRLGRYWALQTKKP